MINIMKKIASKYVAPLALATSFYFLSGYSYAQSLPITEETKIAVKQNQDKREEEMNSFVSKRYEEIKDKFNKYLVDGCLTTSERKDILEFFIPLIEFYPKRTTQEMRNLYDITKKSLQSVEGTRELEKILKNEGVNVKVQPPITRSEALRIVKNSVVAIGLLFLLSAYIIGYRKK